MWTALALLFTPQTYIINLQSPTPLSIWRALSANFVLFYIWAFLTPLVLWIGKKFALESKNFWRNLFILFLLGFPVAVLQVCLIYLFNFLLLSWSGNYRSPVPIIGLLLSIGANNIMIYWGILAASQAMNYFNRYREREKSLAQAQLVALKTQLHPHFLFNTLNAIAELTYDSPETADRTLTKLSDLLRLSLETGKTQEVSLKEELEFLQKYLEIQKTLLQERLTINYEIERQTLPACVPNMLLQPLVENSIRHGIAPRERGGTITVRSQKIHKNLLLQIEDDGLGIDHEGNNFKEGLGLSNTRKRLLHLYDGNQRFDLDESATGGVKITITMPFSEHEGDKDGN